MKIHAGASWTAFRTVVAAIALVLPVSLYAGAAEPAPVLDKPLIAYWPLDEQLGGGMIQDASEHPAMNVRISSDLTSRHGVYGNALECQGKHALKSGAFGQAETAALSLSAWVRPSELGGFREIYRQECGENRVLFSFQGDGNILALGLNIGGYVECDARVEPAKILDGAWHHCAATFDGTFMRVYVDGIEVGALERPGKITLKADCPGFIGSSGGENEYFHGGLDDLRIYAAALTAEEMEVLHAHGREALVAFLEQMDAAVGAFYQKADTFAAALALARKSLAESPAALDVDLKDAFLHKLKTDFPEETADFAEYTGANPMDYALAGGNDFIEERVAYLMELMLEYKPLTEHQWSTQTPDNLRKWEEADRIKARYDSLKAEGAAGQFSPEWIDLILAAGPKIQFRPHINEPVAPYVRPATPETVNLGPEEAQLVLERDWTHQCGGSPTSERIQSEIDWTRAQIARIAAEHPGETDFAAQSAELDTLAARAAAAAEPDLALYFAVRRVKREIMFKNPAVDFAKVVFVDMPYPAGSEWPHETRHRLGYMAVPGARLLVLDGLAPDGRLTQLLPQAPLHGSFWRPDVSFDGTKVLVSFKPHNEKSFHIYEINADGSGLRQLTDGMYDDFDPIYLPDGQHILFPTTRGHTYVRCMPPTNAFVLARADMDGRNIYLISSNNEPDYLPSVMNDGRVIYTRWEYTDKPLWRAQKLWTINPDGAMVSTFWGNQSVWPDLMKDVRAIPGSRRVMFTGSAHHNWFSGSVGIIDPDKGLNFPDGLTKVTADVEWPECGNGPVDPVESPDYHRSGDYPAYYSPYPLSEKDFLVSAKRGDKFLLYLMDVDGNRELIYEGVNNIFHTIPLKARPVPPLIADRAVWPTREERDHPENGVLFSNNVYHGAPPELLGKAKYLRILHIEEKTYTYWNRRPYLSTGPVVSAVQSEGVKRVLGTVPIEEDGSVSFEAQPGMALHFQLLDENYRALHTMRSFVGLMPGERRGCFGCHESHSRTPELGNRSIALSNAPRRITPPPWGNDTVSYPRYVQPVLDKYCGTCHQGNGKACATLDLTERPTTPIFTEPYMTLIGRPSWGAPYVPPEKPTPGFGIANVLMVEGYSTVDPAAYKTPKPMTCLSYKSRLIEIASSGKHHDVKVDDISLQRLIAWIDAMCPYMGDEEVRQIPDPVFQGVDWLAVRPLVASAPVIVRPGPID